MTYAHHGEAAGEEASAKKKGGRGRREASVISPVDCSGERGPRVFSSEQERAGASTPGIDLRSVPTVGRKKRGG